MELDIYPRGGHVMYEPLLQRDVMRRNYEWFTRWIPADDSGSASLVWIAPAGAEHLRRR